MDLGAVLHVSPGATVAALSEVSGVRSSCFLWQRREEPSSAFLACDGSLAPDVLSQAPLKAFFFLRCGEASDISSTDKASGSGANINNKKKEKAISAGLLLHYGIC